MNGRTLSATLLALVLVASAAVVPAAGQDDGLEDDAIVTIDVEPTPENPDPGENVTFQVTVENVVENARTYNLQRAELRETPDQDDEIDGTDVGTSVNGGQTVSTSVSEQFDQSGEYRRYVHLQMLSPTGDVINLVREVNVTVEQSHPALSLGVDSVDGDGDATLSVSVANSLPNPVRGVTLEFGDGDVAVVDDRAVVSELAAGEQTSVTVDAENVTPGRQTVPVELSYVTNDGEARSTTERLATRIGGGDADIRLTDVRFQRDGGELQITGKASNLGDSAVSGVVVGVGEGDGVGPGTSQSEAFVGTIAPDNESEFAINAALDANGSVTVPLEVEYADGGRRTVSEQSATYDPGEPAEVSLTGVSVEREGQELVVRGSASNLDDGNVSGVVVSVRNGEDVAPGQSQAEYFVGSIPGSDFSSFEVHAALPGGTNGSVTIPLQIRYSDDGREVTRTFSREYRPGAQASPDGSGQSSLGMLIPVLGIAVVAGLAIVGWRRYQ
ncbi:hypothetical protein [Halomicrobium salinisoli]|uniref:hypothetical protein n=1 Tax=Halomicrobium salinisoli TaxID=2878391 RepID=UPI001CF02083|nr:hypothetical protein [Halomicrobium salinisoli]